MLSGGGEASAEELLKLRQGGAGAEVGSVAAEEVGDFSGAGVDEPFCLQHLDEPIEELLHISELERGGALQTSA